MNTTLTVHSKGKPIHIYAFETGKVSMKTKAHTGRFRPFFMRVLDILFDKQFTGWLPIYTWLIDHPEGLFLVDSGVTTRVNDYSIYDKAGMVRKWFARTQVKTIIKPEEEIGARLKQANIRPEQIKSVVLTHTHMDHTDGLHYFKGSDIIVNKKEWENRDMPWLLPEEMRLKEVDLEKNSIGAFDRSYSITQENDLLLLPTPGHSRGHCSLLLKADEMSILFAGDIVYDQEQLVHDQHIGVNDSLKDSVQTFQKLKAFMEKHPTIVLPSHDPNAVKRLVHRIPFPNNHPAISAAGPGIVRRAAILAN